MNHEHQTTLELLIDQHGLASLLQTLASICQEKADHIQASYGTGPGIDPLAKAWTRDANKINRCANAMGC